MSEIQRSGVGKLVNRLFNRDHRRTDPLASQFSAARQATLAREATSYGRLPTHQNRDQLCRDVFGFVKHKSRRRWPLGARSSPISVMICIASGH